MEKQLNDEQIETMNGYILRAAELYNGFEQCHFGKNALDQGDILHLIRFIYSAAEMTTPEEAREYYLKSDFTFKRDEK